MTFIATQVTTFWYIFWMLIRCPTAWEGLQVPMLSVFPADVCNCGRKDSNLWKRCFRDLFWSWAATFISCKHWKCFSFWHLFSVSRSNNLRDESHIKHYLSWSHFHHPTSTTHCPAWHFFDQVRLCNDSIISSQLDKILLRFSAQLPPHGFIPSKCIHQSTYSWMQVTFDYWLWSIRSQRVCNGQESNQQLQQHIPQSLNQRLWDNWKDTDMYATWKKKFYNVLFPAHVSDTMAECMFSPVWAPSSYWLLLGLRRMTRIPHSVIISLRRRRFKSCWCRDYIFVVRRAGLHRVLFGDHFVVNTIQWLDGWNDR